MYHKELQASILFIIMILNINENLKNSTSGLFAYDTTVNTKIRTYEDTELLQLKLNNIYKWADENLMEFIEKKK